MDIMLRHLFTILRDSSGPISVRAIAESMGLSTAKVKRLLQNAQEILPPDAAVISSKVGNGQGYSLKVVDEEKFGRFLASSGSGGRTDDRNARLFELMQLLIFSDAIKAEELAERFHISRSQVSSDLKQIRQIMGEHDLELKSIPYRGLVCCGTEFNKRICLLDGIARFQGKASPFLAGRLPAKEMVAIQEILSDVLTDELYNVAEDSFQRLLIHVYVMVLRTRTGHVYDEAFQTENDIHDQDYLLSLAEKLLSRLSSTLHVQFAQQESVYIAIQLAASRYLSDAGTYISPEINDLVDQFLEQIYRGSGIDFSDNFDLRVNLGLFFIPLSSRIKYKLPTTTPFLIEIKRKYMHEFDMALIGASAVEKTLNCKLSEDEIGFLAMYLALAANSGKSMHRKNGLLVSKSNMVTASLVKQSLETRFSKYLNELDQCAYSELGEQDLSKYDYIFSTVPILENMAIPVINIQYFLTESEFEKIEQRISKEEFDFQYYFPRELFMPALSGSTAEEIIQEMTAHIRTYRRLPDDFAREVMKRENLSATDMGYKTAFPHPMRRIGNTTFACVGVLPRPVLWSQQKVSLVILVSVQKKAPAEIQSFQKKLAQFLNCPSAVDTFIQSPEYETLREIFLEM